MILDSPTLTPPPIFARATDRKRLVLVGDSTVCEQDTDSNYRGWGQFLLCDSPAVEVMNLAKSGASTKTFLEDGSWNEALQLRPDWIALQFGHNDSHASDQPESTRADGEYADNLSRFVADARAHDAMPILITPVRRFVFGADNRLSESSSALLPYAVAMRRVGCNLNVPLVDLFAASTRYFEEIGPAACDELSPVPGEDYTHFNPIGARAVAVLVERELRQIMLALK